MKIGGRQRKERGFLCSRASKLYVHIPFNPQYHKTLIKPTEMMETMKTETGLHSIICLIVPSLRNFQSLPQKVSLLLQELFCADFSTLNHFCNVS